MNNGKITLRQLDIHIFKAAHILICKMDASKYKEYIFGMLFLKRASDLPTDKRIHYTLPKLPSNFFNSQNIIQTVSSHIPA